MEADSPLEPYRYCLLIPALGRFSERSAARGKTVDVTSPSPPSSSSPAVRGKKEQDGDVVDGNIVNEIAPDEVSHERIPCNARLSDDLNELE